MTKEDKEIIQYCKWDMKKKNQRKNFSTEEETLCLQPLLYDYKFSKTITVPGINVTKWRGWYIPKIVYVHV